jgi:peptidoglycan/LPS O-acetylase OafA/YrhL
MPSKPAAVKRDIELDFIRGIAILLVLIFHYRTRNRLISSPFLNRIEAFGWTGVDIFFVLSGFLVGGLMLKEWKTTGKVDAVRFLKRRAFKIWPAYYLFLLAAAVIHVRPLKSFFWQNLLNIQNYIPTTLSHTWSLAVEEHFYLSLAALMALVSVKRWRPATLLMGCIVAALSVEALRAALILTHREFFFYTHTRVDALLLGVALAIVRYFYPEWFAFLQRQRIVLCLLVAAALAGLYFNTDLATEPQRMTSPYLITVVDYASAALLLLLFRPGKRHRMPYRLLARIGVFSYGIYLWHVSVIRPVDWAVRHVPAAIAPVTSTFLPYLLAIPLGIAAAKLVELPFLKLRERVVPATIPEPQIPVG